MSNIKHILPYVGSVYGRWTVVATAPMRVLNNGIKISAHTCRCSCGTVRVVSDMYLTGGQSKSCGCFKADWVRAYFRGRKRLDPEVAARNYFLRSYKSGAETRLIFWGLTDSEFDRIIKMDCYSCGAAPSNPSVLGGNSEFYRNGIDRINSEDYYHKDNVVPCCKQCNWAKSNKTQAEFIEWAVQVAKHSGGMA